MTLDDIIQGVAKALEPKFENIEKRFARMEQQFARMDKQIEGVKSMVAALQADVRVVKLEQQGLTIAIDAVNHRIDKLENKLLDAIGDIAPDLTTSKDQAEKLEARITTLERLQKTA